MYYYQFRMKGLPLNLLSLFLFFALFLWVTLICQNLMFYFTPKLFFSLLVWFVLHELFHGIGFACFGKVKQNRIVYGAKLEHGIFYCMCKEEISKANILVALLFPFFFLGIVTLVIGLWWHWPILILLSVLNISGAAGDLVMFFAILRMPKKVRYLDMDDPTSFVIVSPDPLSRLNYFGLQLIADGDYDAEKQVAFDYRKLVISKPSVYFLLFYLVLLGLTQLIS